MSATEEDQSELPQTIGGRFVWPAASFAEARSLIVRFPDAVATSTGMFDRIYTDEHEDTLAIQFRGRFSPALAQWFVEDLGFMPMDAYWVHQGPEWQILFDTEEHATMFTLKWL